MPPDLRWLYTLMLRSRLLEEAIAGLWREGLISGEMHLGTGEEAIVAGVVTHLREGDAMALDFRRTAALFLRGVDPVAIVREPLGRSGGRRVCAGGPIPEAGCDRRGFLRRRRHEPRHVDGIAEPGGRLEPAGALCLEG